MNDDEKREFSKLMETDIRHTLAVHLFASEKLQEIREFALVVRIDAPDVVEEFETSLSMLEDAAKDLFVDSARSLNEWRRNFPTEYTRVAERA